LWLFWIAPLAGALAAGALYRQVFETGDEPDIAGRVQPAKATSS
jgi:hypothetical protein